jgi:crossover junction endodeoxyribonuclease RuvC
LMAPQEWRRVLGLNGRSKDELRSAAIARWPALAERFRRKVDADRAEAALIALAGVLRGRP